MDDTPSDTGEDADLPQVEPAHESGGAAQADPFNPVGVTYLVATINDPDGFTNVRAGPSTGAAVIAQVQQGEFFATYRQDTAWWAVGLKDGTEGYIHSSRISVIGPM